MIRNLASALGHILFRPLAWLGWAMLFLALFGLLHLLGWRDDTSIVSGTLAPGGEAMIFRGLAYLVCYFAATLISPILILAAGIWACLERLRARHALPSSAAQ